METVRLLGCTDLGLIPGFCTCWLCDLWPPPSTSLGFSFCISKAATALTSQDCMKTNEVINLKHRESAQ